MGVDADPPVPPIGLGTYQLRGGECERVVRRALELGYRHVDTAEGYGNERAIGRALRGVAREEVFLTTKVWRDHLRPADLRRRCAGSLRRLGTDYLDLYLVHWPNGEVPPEAVVEGFERLREEGWIRAWGVSNHTVRQLRELAPRARVATNQVELHPYFNQRELATACRELGIHLTAYSPLARGAVAGDPVLREIGRARGKTAAQVALRWILQRGHAAIPKASGEAHLRENLDVFDFELSRAELRRIDRRPQKPRLFDFEWSEFER